MVPIHHRDFSIVYFDHICYNWTKLLIEAPNGILAKKETRRT